MVLAVTMEDAQTQVVLAQTQMEVAILVTYQAHAVAHHALLAQAVERVAEQAVERAAEQVSVEQARVSVAQAVERVARSRPR